MGKNFAGGQPWCPDYNIYIYIYIYIKDKKNTKNDQILGTSRLIEE